MRYLAYGLLNRALARKIFDKAANKEGIKMDFAIIFIIANGLLAAVVYFLVTWIWQD